MKKNLIYTLCVMLSGAVLFSSCEDMLEVDSERIDVEMGDLTLNDSVYSVLGILKSVQDIADRTVLLGELRGDLVAANPGKAVYDVQSIMDFNFDSENPYLAVKDYYSIINNCNIFLARVDTSLERSGDKLLMAEYVAVKSVRAWTYLQLAINYGSVPYYTDPILTHAEAEVVMNRPKKSRDEIVSLLIEELTPFEDPRKYPMPDWSGIQTGTPRTSITTSQLFVPIRYLLGELHLWRGAHGDYRIASNYFFKSITDTPIGTTASTRIFSDGDAYVEFSDYDEDYEDYLNVYNSIFRSSYAVRNFSALTVIPMETTTSTGTISYLSDIFFPEVEGAAQVSASPGYVSLSNRQGYLLYDHDRKVGPIYNPNKDMLVGDLRRYTVTGSQRDFTTEEEYNNIILKLNPGNTSYMDNVPYALYSGRTNFVQIVRDMHLYARFAEALIGLSAEENCPDALVMAMETLKSGLKKDYKLRTNLSFVDKEVMIDSLGNITEDTELAVDTIVVQDPVYNEIIRYNFLSNRFEDNIGLHSRGSGNGKHNKYYSLSDTCVARYYGLVKEDSDSLFTTKRTLTEEDYYRYVNDILLDELALEFCFEGNRFGDLIRFAKRAEKDGFTDWKDILAKRVAGRSFNNSVTYYEEGYEMDDALYRLLSSDESKWYLPLPDTNEASEEKPETDSEMEQEPGV